MLTGFSKAAWLVVASGGWWTPKEIVAAIPDKFIDIPRDPAQSLWVMAYRDGVLVRRCFRSHKPEYAVTKECKVPRGLTVAELMDAIGKAY